MTDGKKRPTRRNVRSELDDLRRDARDGGDVVDVNIRTWGVDLAENVDADEADDGVVCIRDGRVLTAAGTCVVDDCDEWALAADGVDRCVTHCNGGDGD